MGNAVQRLQMQSYAYGDQQPRVSVPDERPGPGDNRRGERHWSDDFRQSETGRSVRQTTKTAQAVLGQLARAFHYRDRHVFMRLYKQYVRPHLEFSTQALSPSTKGDKACLEKVQQRAVRMVSVLKSDE
jgi:hypothetical protein